MFYIVVFTDKDVVSIIPSEWLDGTSCAVWPPYKDSLSLLRAIKTRKEPRDTWKSYPIRTLGTAATYIDALHKEQQAEDTSDLQTADDEEEEEEEVTHQRLSKRKRGAPARYQHLVESATKDAPKQRLRTQSGCDKPGRTHGPKSSNSRNVQSTSVTESQRAESGTPDTDPCSPHQPELDESLPSVSPQINQSTLSRSDRFTSSLSTSGSHSRFDQEVSTDTSLPSLPRPPQSSSSCSPSDRFTSSPSTSDSHPRFNQEAASTDISLPSLPRPRQSSSSCSARPSTSMSPLPRARPSEMLSPRSTHTRSDQPESSSSGRDVCIITLLETLNTKMDQMNHKINRIAVKIDALESSGEAVCDLPEDLPLPLQSEDDVTRLERLLQNASNQSSLVFKLGVIGGTTVHDTVRRIMKAVMSNGLAVQYNWLGLKGNKKAFSGLKLKQVILKSVRKNPETTKATDSEVEKYIKEWLRGASDRDGGRSRRTKTVPAAPEEEAREEEEEEMEMDD